MNKNRHSYPALQIYAMVEVKGWTGGQQNIARAMQQAKFYKKPIGAAHAFRVIRDLKKCFVKEGVVSGKDLAHSINDLAKTTQKRQKYRTRLLR